MRERDMNQGKTSEMLRSTGKNGEKRYAEMFLSVSAAMICNYTAAQNEKWSIPA